MTDNIRNQTVTDKFEIIEVSTVSFCYRDAAAWDRLAECFHSDAWINSSWFTGSAHEFIEQARKRMGGYHPTNIQKHILGNPHVTLKGNRAVCEFHIILYQRRLIDGYEFDLQTWSTFIDLFEKREGTWRIVRRTPIYEKDRMDPYKPTEVPDAYFAQMDLSRYPAAIRFHCYTNERRTGRAPSANLVLKGSPEEATIRKEADEWLAER